MKTKTIKTPLMMAEAYGLSSCPSCLVPKNKFLHRPEVQSGFVPKLSHHGGKNTAIAEKHSLASLLSQLQEGNQRQLFQWSAAKRCFCL